MDIAISDFVRDWSKCAFASSIIEPWAATQNAPKLIGAAIGRLPSGYSIAEGIAVHASATIETGAILKAPVLVGPNCFVASGAYLRGGVFLDRGCIVGPACELKTTYMFEGAKVAHLSFVGDSILGAGVNIEAGAMIANYRNEFDDRHIRIVHEKTVIETGVEKFGALVGDDARIGANAVIAPGALIAPGFRLARLSKIDQHPQPLS